MSFETINQILRSPQEVARRCHHDDGLRDIAITSLVCIVAGAAIFGGILGAHRGGLQIVYSAMKVPLALLITLIMTVPAFHVIVGALDRPWPVRTTLTLVLASLGRFSLVLSASSPLVWLFIDGGTSYHGAILVAMVAYAVAFVAALSLLGKGLGSGAGRTLAALCFSAVLVTVGAQSAWALRPYLGRPAQAEVPFLRDAEGGWWNAAATSTRSAAGVYERRTSESEQNRRTDP